MHHELNHFLSSVEKQAFRMAQFATKDTDHALDIVQDTMMVLSQKYATNNIEEWPALFFRILQNKIIDWHRKQTVKNKIFSWFGLDWRVKVVKRLMTTKLMPVFHLNKLHKVATITKKLWQQLSNYQ